MLIGQINLQKGQAGSASLMHFLTTNLRTEPSSHPLMRSKANDSFLICLQEPPVKEGKVISFKGGRKWRK